VARPRSEHAHNAALEATLELLLREGVEGVTFEEVAARSGVAKSTLYRHFGTRAGLISKAAGRCLVEHPTPDTGSLEGDLHFLFERFSQAEDERQVNDILPLLMDEAKRDPEIDELLSSMLAERRRPIRTVLQLAQLRGEIGADLDLDTAMSVLIGPFTYRKMVERKEVTPEFTEAVMQAAIAGLRATAGTLSGQATGGAG